VFLHNICAPALSRLENYLTHSPNCIVNAMQTASKTFLQLATPCLILNSRHCSCCAQSHREISFLSPPNGFQDWVVRRALSDGARGSVVGPMHSNSPILQGTLETCWGQWHVGHPQSPRHVLTLSQALGSAHLPQGHFMHPVEAGDQQHACSRCPTWPVVPSLITPPATAASAYSAVWHNIRWSWSPRWNSSISSRVRVVQPKSQCLAVEL